MRLVVVGLVAAGVMVGARADLGTVAVEVCCVELMLVVEVVVREGVSVVVKGAAVAAVVVEGAIVAVVLGEA